MKKNNKSTIKIIISLILLILLTFLLGYTFAYFTVRVKGNENPTTVNVNSGVLKIDFETSEYINNNVGELIKDEEKEQKADTTNFTISHNIQSKGKARYSLALDDINISDNLKSPDFKWELLKNNEVINSGNFANIGKQTSLTLTNTLQDLDQNQTDSYTFRIWLSETQQDQANLYSGEFNARIALYVKSV